VADSDRASDALREAIAGVAEERAPALVREALAEAESKARARLVAAFEASLLERAADVLRPDPPVPAEKRRPERAPRPATPAEPEQRSEPTELGLYVYGVASADEAEIPDDLPGVDRRYPATLIEHRGLVAIASEVSLEEFGEEPLHENLNDIQWLEEKARAHEEILDQVLSRISVVPMRLCTIYRSVSHLREALDRDYEVFTDALHRLQGTKEWGVKLIAEPGALDRAADGADGEGGSDGELSAGAAYMREKSRAARRRDTADGIADQWAQHVHDAVSDHAVEGLLNPLQNPEVSGHEGDMLLNGVYLVEDERADELAAVVAGLASEYEALGASVELTGPWPPYNFVKGSIEAAR
jgi:hypothetical protein